jgi:capsular exopolysaccharide synthesis family protein
MDIKGTSYIAEQFRNLRTHFIQYSQNTNCKFILLTSCHHGEGKTTTAINLARYLCKNKEKRVLLVDCDMRRPKIKDYITSVSRLFEGMRARDRKPLGISDILMEKDGSLSLNSAVLYAKEENLWILPSVKATGQAAELIETKKFDAMLREIEYLFDYIILDTSPILSTTDPAILGAKIGYVSLVIRCEHTQRETIQGATNLLEQIGINVLGVILTHMRQIIPKYFYRYQYYQGYYYDAYYADVPEQASGVD